MRKRAMPIRIDCEGLSQKHIHALADDLDMLFEDVEVTGEYIVAGKPINIEKYREAIQLCENYGVRISSPVKVI